MDASRARYGLIIAPSRQGGGITNDRVMLVASQGFTRTVLPFHDGWPVWSCIVLCTDVIIARNLGNQVTLGPDNGWVEVEE